MSLPEDVHVEESGAQMPAMRCDRQAQLRRLPVDFLSMTRERWADSVKTSGNRRNRG